MDVFLDYFWVIIPDNFLVLRQSQRWRILLLLSEILWTELEIWDPLHGIVCLVLCYRGRKAEVDRSSSDWWLCRWRGLRWITTCTYCWCRSLLLPCFSFTLEELDGCRLPLTADAAACSCLFFSWNFAARSLSHWIFLDDFFLFGSDRSSINADLCSSVRPVQICLEQSIFIFLGLRSFGELPEHSKSTHKAIREH